MRIDIISVVPELLKSPFEASILKRAIEANLVEVYAQKREKIYHTNVMMCIGSTFAVICLDSIDDKKERKNVINHLKKDNKDIIEITEDQVNQFAGNMLQLLGKNNTPFLIMSQSAFDSLRADQLSKLEKHTKIISSSLQTIEACGGGSARCMMAEIFLPKALK